MARSKDFDLYLVDLDLPDMSGLHVGLALGRLAQRGKLRPSPIVAVTAQSDTATRNRAIHYGFSAFLGKPFTEGEIIELVRHFE